MTSTEVTKDSGHQTDFYIKSDNESRHLEMNKDKSNMEKNSQFGKESISEKEPKTEDNNEKKVTQDHLGKKNLTIDINKYKSETEMNWNFLERKQKMLQL